MWQFLDVIVDVRGTAAAADGLWPSLSLSVILPIVNRKTLMRADLIFRVYKVDRIQ